MSAQQQNGDSASFSDRHNRPAGKTCPDGFCKCLNHNRRHFFAEWAGIFFPLLISLSFSRFLVQTDVYFLRTVPKGIIMLSFFSRFAVIDFVAALSAVPTMIVTVSKYRTKKIRTSIVPLSFILGIVVSIFSALLYALLFSLTGVNAKTGIGSGEFLLILGIVTATIPFRWLQLSTTSVLHLEKKGSVVVMVSFISIFINYAADYGMMLRYGYIGCFLSTLLVTMATAVFFSGYLRIKLCSLFLTKAHRTIFCTAIQNIVKEALRILGVKTGMSLVYGIIFSAPFSAALLVQYSVMFEFEHLTAIIPISVYRTAVVLGQKSQKSTQAAFGFLFIAGVYLLIRLFHTGLTALYGLEHGGIFSYYLTMLIFPLLFESCAALFRADFQLNNRFMRAAVTETIAVYAVLLPVTLYAVHQLHYRLVVGGFILNSLAAALLYALPAVFLCVKTAARQYRR